MQNHRTTSSGTAAKGPVGRAIAEAIDAVAAPAVRDAVLASALRSARRSCIPERGAAVANFVQGPLFFALERVLGETAAAAVCDELRAITAIVEDDEVSEVRPSRPARDSGRDPLQREEKGVPRNVPVPRREPPRVVIASTSPAAVSALTGAFSGSATVEQAHDALTLLESLGPHEQGLIVLDSANPAMRVETLLAMYPELPEGLGVVLWGEPHDLDERVAALGTRIPDAWVRCGTGATADDVAAACRRLLG